MIRRAPVLVVSSWVAALLPLGCGGGGGGGGPTSPPPPAPNPAVASFTVSGAGGDQVISYVDGPNLVFCRRAAGWADLWIRLAEQRSANGDDGPHVDIDVCNDAGGGAFTPIDPQAAQCGGGKGFDIWWHDNAANAYANEAQAPQCSLALIANGNQLEGAFSCRGLAEQGGAGRVDVLDGTFRCTVT